MASEPKVLHLMQCTNLGGMEQVALRTMEALAAHGVTFRIATPRPFGPARDRVLAFDAQARDFAYRGRFGWRDFPAFRRHVRRLARECSHVWVTGTSAAALGAVRGLDRPRLLSHHYHHFEGPGSWLRWRLFYELLCRGLDRVVYPTAFTRDEALGIAPWLGRRAVVVPNGYEVHFSDAQARAEDSRAARARLGLPADALIVGNAGWLIARKRFDVFLDTACRIRAARPDAVFVICGGGPLEPALKDRARALGIDDAVRFEGWVADLADYYRAFDVLLFNSDFDTLPSAPLEAASYGCPIVASLRYGGLGEFICDGVNGHLFGAHDAANLARTALDLAADPARADGLRAAAAATLRERFSMDGMTRFYLQFFGHHPAGHGDAGAGETRAAAGGAGHG